MVESPFVGKRIRRGLIAYGIKSVSARYGPLL